MIHWAQLLHFYQPPTQMSWVLDKICTESYRPLIDVFREHPHARATVNINAVLTEMLRDFGKTDIIDGLAELVERGQLEMVDSAKFHPILPLIPESEMERQIAQNRRTNRQFFGRTYEPRGFFSPEMCFGPEIVRPIARTDHEWIILGGVACPTDWPMDVIHEVEVEGDRLAVFFRDDILSNKISFQSLDSQGFLQHMQAWDGGDRETYIVTAMDAETFGHHIQDWEKLFLAEVYDALEQNGTGIPEMAQRGVLAEQQRTLVELSEREPIRTVTLSELLEKFPRGDSIMPKSSSWSTTAEDIAHGNPYPLWKDKDNRIHQLQWEHTDIAIELVQRAVQLADDETSRRFATIARGLLDRGLHSCQYWWASKRPMWDINLVHKGLLQQWEAVVNAYKAINASGASSKLKTEYYYRVVVTRDLRNKIVDQLFFG